MLTLRKICLMEPADLWERLRNLAARLKGSLRRRMPPLTRAAERPAKTPSMKAKHLHEVPAKVEYLYRVSGVQESKILCGREDLDGSDSLVSPGTVFRGGSL